MGALETLTVTEAVARIAAGTLQPEALTEAPAPTRRSWSWRNGASRSSAWAPPRRSEGGGD